MLDAALLLDDGLHAADDLLDDAELAVDARLDPLGHLLEDLLVARLELELVRRGAAPDAVDARREERGLLPDGLAQARRLARGERRHLDGRAQFRRVLEGQLAGRGEDVRGRLVLLGRVLLHRRAPRVLLRRRLLALVALGVQFRGRRQSEGLAEVRQHVRRQGVAAVVAREDVEERVRALVVVVLRVLVRLLRRGLGPAARRPLAVLRARPLRRAARPLGLLVLARRRRAPLALLGRGPALGLLLLLLDDELREAAREGAAAVHGPGPRGRRVGQLAVGRRGLGLLRRRALADGRHGRRRVARRVVVHEQRRGRVRPVHLELDEARVVAERGVDAVLERAVRLLVRVDLDGLLLALLDDGPERRAHLLHP
mmetsp:Transcript_27791/g.94638  ORF Transcript_27791/g.94638 Transcript_27791/m.94638 type:complete len:371 (-) Transcript_27791:780-1892(-)